MIDYISAYKSQMAFVGLGFQADKPRMNAELRVMIGWIVTKIKLNWTQNNNTWQIHPCKSGRIFSCKQKLKSSQVTEAFDRPGGNRDVFSHINTY